MYASFDIQFPDFSLITYELMKGLNLQKNSAKIAKKFNSNLSAGEGTIYYVMLQIIKEINLTCRVPEQILP